MTTDLPTLSAREEVAEDLGVSINVVHEPDSVYLSINLRIPRGDSLNALVDALTSQDAGFSRGGFSVNGGAKEGN